MLVPLGIHQPNQHKEGDCCVYQKARASIWITLISSFVTQPCCSLSTVRMKKQLQANNAANITLVLSRCWEENNNWQTTICHIIRQVFSLPEFFHRNKLLFILLLLTDQFYEKVTMFIDELLSRLSRHFVECLSLERKNPHPVNHNFLRRKYSTSFKVSQVRFWRIAELSSKISFVTKWYCDQTHCWLCNNSNIGNCVLCSVGSNTKPIAHLETPLT